MALLTSWLTATALVPDTLVVINRSAQSTDYMPLYTAILVAAVAVVSTLVQRRIADRAVEVQRELAEKTIEAQVELARKENVVQSRREWARELRSLVGTFQSISLSLGFRARKVDGTTEDVDQQVAELAELRRLHALIALLLDLSKPEHKAIDTTLQALVQFSIWPSGVADAKKQPGDEAKYKEARKFRNHGDAFATLEQQVAALLEANWQKIKEGT